MRLKVNSRDGNTTYIGIVSVDAFDTVVKHKASMLAPDGAQSFNVVQKIRVNGCHQADPNGLFYSVRVEYFSFTCEGAYQL